MKCGRRYKVFIQGGHDFCDPTFVLKEKAIGWNRNLKSQCEISYPMLRKFSWAGTMVVTELIRTIQAMQLTA